MRALIDPRINRVCEVAGSEFPVAPPLFWVDAPDGIVPDSHTYEDGHFVEPVPMVIEQPPVVDPVAKLAAFLAKNPDVAALLK